MCRNGDERPKTPDPDVVPMAERRRFSAGEKLRILEEADACTEPGEVGALLRREGIYSSYVSPVCANMSETTLLKSLGNNEIGRGE